MILQVYPDKELQGLSWSDFYSHFKDIILDSKNTVSDQVPYNMYKLSKEGEYDLSAYYWIDPLYQQSVRKKSVFTKFNFEKENKKGIIVMGYNIENLTFTNEYKSAGSAFSRLISFSSSKSEGIVSCIASITPICDNTLSSLIK